MSPKDKILKVSDENANMFSLFIKQTRSMIITLENTLSESDFKQYQRDMIKSTKEALLKKGASPSLAVKINSLIYDSEKSIESASQELYDILNDEL